MQTESALLSTRRWQEKMVHSAAGDVFLQFMHRFIKDVA
jgi:hypothetical protein